MDKKIDAETDQREQQYKPKSQIFIDAGISLICYRHVYGIFLYE